MFAATDDCINDKRRGLFSYEALATRLAGNRFASDQVVDYSAPVLGLANLTPEDCFVLLLNLRRVHAGGDESKFLLPNEGIEAYLHSCQQRMGAAYFQTPRDTVKDFVGLLNVLQQNSSCDWRSLIGQIKTVAPSTDELDAAVPEADDDLASFRV
jgi:hypothetical protein